MQLLRDFKLGADESATDMALRYLEKVDITLPVADVALDRILRNEVLRAMPGDAVAQIQRFDRRAN